MFRTHRIHQNRERQSKLCARDAPQSSRAPPPQPPSGRQGSNQVELG
jgi:hypothetical protein